MTTERSSNWLDAIAYSLIHRAAAGAPLALSERLEEEWLADMAERRGAVSRLRFAIGCAWAIRVIAYEHRLAALPASGSSAARGAFFGQGGAQPLFSRRTTTFILVLCLHAGVFYGLAIGLRSQFMKPNDGPMIIDEMPPAPRDPLPVPGPTIAPTRLYVPTPEMPPLPSDPEKIAGDQNDLQNPPTPPRPIQDTHVVARVSGGPGAGFPGTGDYYPSMAIFHGESGAATVNVCVDPKGRLTSAPTLVQSTGSSRLDEGALRLARAGSGHYRASTEDGQPVSSCYPFRIRFDLKK